MTTAAITLIWTELNLTVASEITVEYRRAVTVLLFGIIRNVTCPDTNTVAGSTSDEEFEKSVLEMVSAGNWTIVLLSFFII